MGTASDSRTVRASDLPSEPGAVGRSTTAKARYGSTSEYELEQSTKYEVEQEISGTDRLPSASVTMAFFGKYVLGGLS